LESGSRIKK